MSVIIYSLVLFSTRLWCVSEVILRDRSCRQRVDLLHGSSVLVRSVFFNCFTVLFMAVLCVCVCVRVCACACVCVESRCCSMAGTCGCRDVNIVRRLRCCHSPGKPGNTSGTSHLYLICSYACPYCIPSSTRHCALKRVFPGWKAFVVLRRHHKVQVTLADQHFKSIALPKYIIHTCMYMYTMYMHVHVLYIVCLVVVCVADALPLCRATQPFSTTRGSCTARLKASDGNRQ